MQLIHADCLAIILQIIECNFKFYYIEMRIVSPTTTNKQIFYDKLILKLDFKVSMSNYYYYY